MTSARSRRCGRAALGLLVIFAMAAPGCSGYQLQGKVVEGSVSEMAFVAAGDPRLAEPGLRNVRLTVRRDPGSLGRRLVASQLSGADGRFVIPLNEFGSGWMQEEWLIRATKQGFQMASLLEELEWSYREMRLLVILAPGVSPVDEEDLMEQFEHFR